MIRVLRSVWIWTAGLALVLFWLALLGAIWLFDRDPLRRRTGRWFRYLGRALAWINPWRLQVSGADHVQRGRTYVVVSNHQSLADIPVLSHLEFDTKWLAKAELFRAPILGWMMRMAGDVPVERGDRTRSARALLQCARYLRQQCSVVFFPEGTRSPDGEVLPFNEGPFQLAIREKVAVLPVAVDGTLYVLPRSSLLFGPARQIRMTILEPMMAESPESAAFRDVVRQRIIDELRRLRQGRAAS